jgi:hypothetical protein
MAVPVSLALKPNTPGNSPFVSAEPFAQCARIDDVKAISGDVLQSLF